jgi:hypothetical protein
MDFLEAIEGLDDEPEDPEALSVEELLSRLGFDPDEPEESKELDDGSTKGREA